MKKKKESLLSNVSDVQCLCLGPDKKNLRLISISLITATGRIHFLIDNLRLYLRFISADKASNNIVFVCKNYYYECLLNELGSTTTSGNPTRTNLTKDNIL
jgi:hypothetical protein